MGSLGEKIRVLRKERKLTQQELAKGLVTASMISQIESDKATPSQQLLEQLAARLGVKPSYFAQDIHHKTDLSQTYRRAKALMESGNYAAALPLLHTVLAERSPQFREETIYSELGQCYEHLGQLTEASVMYDNVVRASIERSDIAGAVHAYYHLGHLHRKQQHFAVARMFWRRAAELLRRHPSVEMPLSVKIHANLGRTHYQLKEYAWAYDSYKRAAALAERYSSTLDAAMIQHGLGVVCMQLGRHDEAEQCLVEAIRMYDLVRHQRGVNQCHVNRGVNLRLTGRLQEAIEQLSWCVQNREIQGDVIRLANALCERALCHAECGHWDQALQDAREALNLDKDTPDLQATARHVLALASLETGRTEEALQFATEGVPYAERAGGGDLLARLEQTRMRACYETGRHEEVRAAMRNVIALAETVLFPQK